VATTIISQFNPALITWIYLDFDKIFFEFQIWRLVTNFFYFGRFSFNWLFSMYLLQKYFKGLEGNYFTGPRGFADFVFMLSFSGLVFLVIAYLWGLMFLGAPLVYFALYVFARKDPYQDVMLWSFRVPQWQLPFALMLVTILMGGSPMDHLLGILVGHIFHFLSDVVPQVYRKTLLRTPDFLYNFFERRAGVDAARPAAQQGWMRGSGHRLAD